MDNEDDGPTKKILNLKIYLSDHLNVHPKIHPNHLNVQAKNL